MKRGILPGLLLMITVISSGQTLTLSGRVFSYSIKVPGKIFYTAYGKKFSAGQFVTFDSTGHYRFIIGLDQIQKEHIDQLVFSADTNSNSSNADACNHIINTKAIIGSSKFKNAASLALKTDLPLEFNCEATMYYGADMDGKEWLSGNYLLQSADTLRQVKLSKELYHYRSQLTIPTAQLMDDEFGSWKYNEATRQLTITVEFERNLLFGLMLGSNRQFTFDVVKSPDGKLSFKSDRYTLTKQ